MKDIIVVAGPTAVGKTEYAIKIAKAINGEVVSCDSMQLYKYMDIGSAKPTPEEQAQVKHHLVDEIDPGEPFSVARYQKLAKEAIIARLRTERVNKSSILWNYVNAQDMNRTEDIRKLLYEKIQTMTLQDVIKFQQEWVKGRTYHYGILGKKEDLDMEALKKMGTVVELTTEDIFGY